MSWLQANAQVLNALAGVLVLGVWAIYLHLFWRGYRRQLRASIIISRGAGSSLDALCLVSNMSREAVFLEGIVVFVERDGRQSSTVITELSELSGGDGRRSPREGPLKSGDYIDIGTFRDLVASAVGEGAGDRKPEANLPTVIEVWVVADYSSENDMVFVKRRFSSKKHGSTTAISSEGLKTKRMRKRGERDRVMDVLQASLENSAP